LKRKIGEGMPEKHGKEDCEKAHSFLSEIGALGLYRCYRFAGAVMTCLHLMAEGLSCAPARPIRALIGIT
jgi:hypothetical protein